MCNRPSLGNLSFLQSLFSLSSAFKYYIISLFLSLSVSLSISHSLILAFPLHRPISNKTTLDEAALVRAQTYSSPYWEWWAVQLEDPPEKEPDAKHKWGAMWWPGVPRAVRGLEQVRNFRVLVAHEESGGFGPGAREIINTMEPGGKWHWDRTAVTEEGTGLGAGRSGYYCRGGGGRESGGDQLLQL